MLLIKPYDRERAVEYARRWALSRNPLFEDFSRVGGDCTSFVSQCVLAGGCIMDRRLPFGWFYASPDDRAPAWSGVEFFYDYLVGDGGFSPPERRVGPFGEKIQPAMAEAGDVIQLADGSGDYYHTLIVVGRLGNELLVAAHTDDALDRPLSSYDFAALRCVRVWGFRLEGAGDDCFEYLMNGGAPV